MPYVISRPEQVRALASPVRQDIVDAIEAIGPATAPEIARTLGRAPDGLYFHLRLLTKVGLLKERETSNTNGRSVATYDVPGRPMRIKYDLGERAAARRISRVTASMLRTANRSFERAAAAGQARVNGPGRELWAGRTRGRLSRRQLQEVNRILHHLIETVGSRPVAESECLYEVTFVLSPAPSR